MAEVAGLIIGVVGLAGVIGAFKNAIDLFSGFMNSRAFGRDYEILDTKIDIERAILLQWPKQLLLGDEAKLKSRYGLMESGRYTSDQGNSEAFEELTEELAYFTTKLTQIVPVSTTQECSTSLGVGLDPNVTEDLQGLKVVLDASDGCRKDIAKSARRHLELACQERILRKLWFRNINERKQSKPPSDTRIESLARKYGWAIPTTGPSDSEDSLEDSGTFEVGVD
ncbi:uncharacterized protein F4822DRAFT_440740 [Hypoxylon trugodes]|uniref:uncharacterized protein n=1 Tax=Hypoxylon trugodes TaxID=326681 RepID=UPI0021956447|nr:uncharacterized protein F4822DRAFT_440740 [Hypoxylon trugodes]KAI1383020.1 hypothetical protein F4822DRAFT_440740 [Hypoxylon trugodes]